ncbi:MAG: DMT family transporter [Actinomycetia bacterium]|nr:DMT family transporter [Actinomycetes bacterium]MCP4083495.1 DMT family transporter [Actinomycetes bacterium]
MTAPTERAGDPNGLAARLPASENTLGLIGAGVAVTAWGASGVLAKGIDMDGLAISAYRFWMYALAMVVVLAVRGSPVTMHTMRHSMAGGIALALDVAFFFSAVKLTTIVDATVIGSMQPVILMFAAGPLFGERIGARNAGWAGVALAGAVGVVMASSGTPEWNIQGDLLSAGAVFAWSGYFVFSKRSKGVISPTEFTVGTALWVALITTPLAAVFGQDLSPPSAVSWFWLTVMAFGSGILGHSVMNWSLVRIPLWVGSVLTLLVPVVSSLLAWAFLNEAITTAQALAMAVVIGALSMIVRSDIDS